MRKVIFTLFILPFLASAQTPSNLVPPSARIPELRTWIDAEEQSVTNGSAVTTVTDQAGVISGITVQGLVTLNISASGKKEFSFSGLDNSINLGQPAALDFVPGTNEFTIMGLMGTGVPNNGALISKGGASGVQYHIEVSNNKFWIRVGDNPSSNIFEQSNGLLNENMHFTLVASQNESKLYINGQLIETKGSGSIGTATHNEDILIGDTATWDWESADHIRNVGIFAKALSISEIQAIYNDIINPPVDTQAPTASILSLTGNTDTTVDLSWSGATDDTGVTGYKVFKNSVLEATLGNVNTYQVTGLTASTAYNFTVKAVDAAGNESSNSNVVSVTTAATSGGGTSSTIGFWDKSGTTVSISSISDNLAIGRSTVPTGYKLAVDGKIRSREVKVDNDNWADYVFLKEYKLPTLQEVEKHIKEKGHLINIPSAAIVKANGLELGEINRLLLEKIEELTLYTLEQEREIIKLKLLENRLISIENQLIKAHED
tara:strand:+ start:12075 stop:13544 length:1470 start_codon:yes stop_codon:yes gene_type:complete